ncbi:putative N-acetyltransferase YjaB [compost metagenome]
MTAATNYSLRPSVARDHAEIYQVWHRSVKSTHHFLTEQDFDGIALQVQNDYVPHAAFTLIVDGADKPCGFMGMTDAKIDSLFIDPAHFGKGLGKMLIDFAKSKYPALAVDVNEDNNGAAAFYEKMGFKIVGRSELDDAGRPLPILHLKWN